MKLNGQAVNNLYAGRRLSGLGFDLDMAGAIKRYVDEVVSQYEARIGRFLTYKEKLLNFRTRLTKLSTVASVRQSAYDLSAEVETAVTNQNALQSEGLNIFTLVERLKTDPIVKNAMDGKLPEYWELDKLLLLQNTYDVAMEAKNNIASWLAKAGVHEDNIKDLEGRLENLETSSGVSVAKIPLSLAQVPTGVWIGVGFLALKIVGGGLIKLIRGKK